MYFLGYDVGSSSIKASLIEGSTNELIASSQSPTTELSMIAHQPGWAEQEPSTWWSHIIKATHDILSSSSIDSREIKAIGISYQMHGLVMVDKELSELRPSIIWCDSRAIPYGNRAEEILGQDYCQKVTLNAPGNFTVAKLAWVKEHEPSIYARCHKMMLPGDYIALKLSGEATTTHSGLSEGIMYDFVKNQISEEVLSALDIDKDLIPRIVPTFGEQTKLSKSAADELGLPIGTPITYRAGDQPNNALSLNVLQPGELAATAGTSGVIYGINDTLNNDHKSRVNAFAHVNHLPQKKRIGILLCINGTGILNAWIKNMTGSSGYEEMNSKAASVPVGSDGVMTYPFGNGSERVLENKNMGAAIHGLQFNRHDQGHLYRSAQEGIACALTYGTEIMTDIGIRCETLKAGQANLFLSDIFQTTLANLTGATIELYNTDGAQGAARGAGIGLGYYSFQDAFSGLHLRKRIEPNIKKKAQYQELYHRWKEHLVDTL